MRVERLDLSAFGHYQDTTVDLAGHPGGLTVVHGPNEAGKSTARRALLAALFGVERDSPDAYRAGVHGLRVGATVRAAGGETIAFVRRGLSHLEDGDGSPLDPAALDRLLGGVDRATFGRLFAVGHDELQRGSASLLDAEGEIGRLVFGASLGSGSVAAVLGRLNGRAADLYRDRGSAQAIPKALAAYRSAMKQAREARVRGRDWERLRRAAGEAEQARDEVRRAFDAARDRQLRLDRTRAARPLLTRRRALIAELDALGAQGTVPDVAWADRATEALARERAARAELEAARVRRDRLATDAREIDLPGAVLAAAADVDVLVEGIGRYEKDTGDVPKRRAELDAERTAARAHLQHLGKTSDDGQVVAEAELVAVQQLAGEHKELLAATRIASDELEQARAREREARDRLAAHAEPPDVAALARALERARTKLDTARGLAGSRRAQSDAVLSLAARAARLGLAALERAEIESLAVPHAALVDAERARRHAHGSETAHLDDALARVAESLRIVDQRLREATTQAPDPSRVEAARSHRDEGWRAVRATAEGRPHGAGWAGGRPLLDAFEDAVRDADRAADERDEHAEAIAAVSQLRAQRSDLEREEGALEERRTALAEAGARELAAWEAEWARIGVGAGTPDEMAQWLAEERELVATLRRWREQETGLGASEVEVAQLGAQLAHELTEAGEPPCAEDLDLLVAQADALVARVRAAEVARRDAVLALDTATRDVPRRSGTLARQRAALEEWQRAWTDALRPLGLPGSAGTEPALAAASAHRGLAAARTSVAALEHRIEGIETDRRRYEEQVGALAAGLLADADARTPRAAVSELQRRVRAARDAEQRRQALEEQIAQASAAVRAAEEELALARRARRELREEAGLPAAAGEEDDVPGDEDEGGPAGTVTPGAGLVEAIERARRAAVRRERLAEIDDTLLDQAGGRSVEALEADALAAGDTLGAEIERVTAQVDTLQQELESAASRVADAHQSVAQVTDAATAADLEQDAEAELALAAAHVSEYARTALAAEVLRRTIADYGERHRGPLLGRSAALFSTLTGGAFTDLVADADGDRQVLLAMRANGELCTVTALSDGTRDQLYLALRLAALEHQIAQAAEPLPVVFDDVLVHFDDGRTESALQVLGDLSARTQVLLFTHHERVVEIAERALGPLRCAVVRLDARRHDVAPPPAAAEPRDAGTGVRDAAHHEEQILAALRSAGSPLGKADLLARTDVPEREWPGAIRALVERGHVVQEGQRRGARYRMAGQT